MRLSHIFITSGADWPNREEFDLILFNFKFEKEKAEKCGKSQRSLSRPVVSIAIAATAHLPSLHAVDGKIITMTTSAFKDAIIGYWSYSSPADSRLDFLKLLFCCSRFTVCRK
jgi:hypothetical protein